MVSTPVVVLVTFNLYTNAHLKRGDKATLAADMCIGNWDNAAANAWHIALYTLLGAQLYICVRRSTGIAVYLPNWLLVHV